MHDEQQAKDYRAGCAGRLCCICCVRQLLLVWSTAPISLHVDIDESCCMPFATCKPHAFEATNAQRDLTYLRLAHDAAAKSQARDVMGDLSMTSFRSVGVALLSPLDFFRL
jgi:hypothetical protein